MSVKIEMLRCFCTVARSGNLAEAAERLGRTQSAVSMTLKQLEEHLGKKLFEGERKNRLSPLGEQVYELSQRQLRQFDTTVQTIEKSAKATHGLIRLVSVPSVAALAFPPLIEATIARHPGLRLELRDTDTQQIIDALGEGRADIGIASGQHPINGVRSEKLFEDRFGLVCAPNHPFALQDTAPQLSDLTATQFIHNNLCDLIETPELRRVFDQAALSIHNTHSLIAMVRTGNWITILPETVARFMPESLAFRPIPGLQDRRQVYLYLHQHSRYRDISEELATLILSQDWISDSPP